MTKDGIVIKRAYDPPDAADGARFLVDGLWPRGISRKGAALTGWLKDLAPSVALRKWYRHDPERWDEFRSRYLQELESGTKRELLNQLRRRAQKERVTLLFAARDVERNNAVVLAEVLGGRAEVAAVRSEDTAARPADGSAATPGSSATRAAVRGA